MTIRVAPMSADEAARVAPADERAGLGTLATERGNLPLDAVDVTARITGLTAHTQLSQSFVNPHGQPLEATYIFPLPDRAAVTAMRMEAAGRVVEGVLKERQEAREDYDRAVAEGRRASIAEQERPDVFTMRVGNILPGERVTVRLTLAGVVPYEDGAATYRFPLVVAPRYIPGTPIDDTVGVGVEPDTDAVPDASRITPPVLLPGFPNPVRLGITVTLDPAGLPMSAVRSSLHQVDVTESAGQARIVVAPGERPDRDFVLRWGLGAPDAGAGTGAVAQSLALLPDRDTGDVEADRGTFCLTLLPPVLPDATTPRDVVLVLDRSGSMGGWKMVAARRAAARIVDSLTATDRLAVLGFDNVIDRPPSLGQGLVPASDRHRFRAVEFLAGLAARGGTEMLGPLRDGLSLLTDRERDRVLVLVTDGQVGNEDQILRELTPSLGTVRVHTVGIDRAVNAGFLGRLAAVGGGRCELVEGEDRLDDAMDRIHRRIGTALVTGLRLHADGLEIDDISPARLPDLFAGAPLRIMGRYRGAPPGAVTVTGSRPGGEPWSATVPGVSTGNPALTPVWARGRLRDLEDRYLTTAGDTERADLERLIVDTSLRHGVLCRFTAFVAVDSRVAAGSGELHRVVQPVEAPAGWQLAAAATPLAVAAAPGMMRAAVTGVAPATIGIGPGPLSGKAKVEQAAQVRELLGNELRRLARLATASAARRWVALADLGSRLRALVTVLAGSDRDAVARLAEQLAVCDGPLARDPEVLNRLWVRTHEVLDRLSAEAAPPAGAPRRSRVAFWKR